MRINGLTGRQGTMGCRVLGVGCRVSGVGCWERLKLLPIAYCLLPIAYDTPSEVEVLPIPYSLSPLPTTSLIQQPLFNPALNFG
ncbi:hypothetical protein [Coleofasciculus sp. E1-EBD-02]|uniref:hypothetical protein n=1 Tax=Coleofasciculus sp. E1-EBD-02 TaxID=3068481 RepID=UPI003303DB8D